MRAFLSAPSGAPAPLRMRWLILAVTALAAGLRLYWIGIGSLDIDEAFTVWVSRHPAHGIWSLLARFDDHPALYYLVLHLWVTVTGDRVVALRLLSVLCGVLAIPLTYWVGSTIGGPALGLLTAILVALSPDNVEWSQEIRMYALETLAIVLAMGGLAWLLARQAAVARSPGPHRWAPPERRPEEEPPQPGGVANAAIAWSAFVVGVAGALWTEYTALLFPLAAAVAQGYVFSTLSGADRRDFSRAWLRAYAVIGVLCVPEVGLLLRQLHSPNVVNWYFVNPYTVLILVLVGTGMVVLGRAIWRAERHWMAFAVALWAVPVASLILVSLRHPILAPRLYFWTYVPLYLAIGAGLLRVRRRWARNVLIGALLAVSVSGLLHHYRNDVLANGLRGWDRAAEYVASRVHPGDVIVFYVPYVQPAFDYYFQRYHRPAVEHGLPVDFGSGDTLFPPLTEEGASRVQELIAGHPRVWFVHGMQPSARAILQTLDRRGRLLDTRVVTNDLRIYLYSVDSSKSPR